jgi:glycosyltransferase involved in cell wall biosynthesis
MKLLVLPRASNPYQRLLYTNPAMDQVEVNYFDPPTKYLAPLAAPVVIAKMVRARLHGTRLAHMHWLYFLELPAIRPFGPVLQWISFVQTMTVLWTMHALGIRLVWTAHNIVAHESQNGYGERIARYTAKLACGIIVHSAQAVKQLAEIGVRAPKKIQIIPHGNYDGVYPPMLSRAAARKEFGFKPGETVILFFGLIRKYKGVEDLLKAFAKLEQPTVRLLIAGDCQDAGLARTISDFAQKYPKQVTFVNQSVPEKDVAMYFHAADITCAPFKNLTTSGSVILAATFGKPIVTPRIGAIKEIPETAGVLYDPHKKDALLGALQTVLASSKRRVAMGKASRAYADGLSWDLISAKTYALYLKALAFKVKS